MDEINPYESPKEAPVGPTPNTQEDNLREGGARRAWRRQDFVIALALQGVLLVFAALLLDAGFLLVLCIIAVVTHWIAAGLIVYGRRTSPTQFDVSLIRYGFVFWLLLAIVATIAVSAFRDLSR
jgi:hypothetical protein